jgi:two-component system nitrogen regulation sensor histidine kinase NtrY
MMTESSPGTPAGRTLFVRLVVSAGLTIAAPSVLALVTLVVFDWPRDDGKWWLLVVVMLTTAALGHWRFRRISYLLQTLSGLLEALREGDYTLRGKGNSPLGSEVNTLAAHLQKQRIHFEESLRLLNKTLNALDSAVLVFGDKRKLRFLNPAAASLLDLPEDTAVGRSAAELGLDVHLDHASSHAQTFIFPGRTSRFSIYTAPLVYDGRTGSLLVMTDIGRALRDEERVAWQRLLRVLSHEVNNSLAPISSIADTLSRHITRQPLLESLRDDLVAGMRVIGDRADSLNRFLAGYSRLNRLPPPERREVELGELVCKIVRLDPSRAEAEPGEPLRVKADPGQIEQALINLLKNAIEASPEGGDKVRVRWRREHLVAVIEVVDSGIGPPRNDNLFVPFFTTKPGGSGIGLMLARSIAEMHDGNVSLEARADGSGSIATLRLSTQYEPSTTALSE